MNKHAVNKHAASEWVSSNDRNPMGSIESFPGHYLLLLSTPCEVPARLMVSAMLDVIKFSSSAVIDRVGRVPGILILILLGLGISLVGNVQYWYVNIKITCSVS